MSDVLFGSATQLAQAIRSGQLTALEVLEEHLAQVSRCNRQINAIVTLDADRARQRAKEADAALARGEVWGPLHGVPITIKDCYETAGLRTTSSYRPLAKYIPTHDAEAVSRLRQAGAVIFAKTNLSMLAADFQSISPLFGRVNNPWDLTRTAGGSSGGSAAAVAAGMSPLDLGSDLGGSIRVPAHYCGIVGLKPTEDRVHGRGHIPDWRLPVGKRRRTGLQHMATYGPLARSVPDLRLCLEIIQRDSLSSSPLERTHRPLSELRLAWMDEFGGLPLTRETREALATTSTKLAQLGCRIERADLPSFDFEQAWKTYGELLGAELAPALPIRLRILFGVLFLTSGRPAMDRGILSGMGMSRTKYLRILAVREELIEQMDHFLKPWDALLCPVSTGPAFTHRRTGTRIEVDEQTIPYMMGAGACTSLFNLLGNPVVVLPLTRSSLGLPLGMQVVGARWRDMELLSIAEKIMEVTGPVQRPNGYEKP